MKLWIRYFGKFAFYHSVDMNTSILLVESWVIWNRFMGLKSKNIAKSTFKVITHKTQCVRCVSVLAFIFKQVITVPYYLLISLIILISCIAWLYCSINVVNLQLKSCLLNLWTKHKSFFVFFVFLIIIIQVYLVINLLSLVCSYTIRKIPMDGCHITFGLWPYVMQHPFIGLREQAEDN